MNLHLEQGREEDKHKNGTPMNKFRDMRRKRQQLSDEESIGILQRATSGTLALLGDNGYPYAVLMYQGIAKVVKTDKERETFLQLAKEEGHHASVFHAYTKEGLKPKKTMARIMSILYYLLGKKRLYKLIADGEYKAAVGYEHLIADFPEVESVKNDEKRHGDMVSGLLE